MKNVRLVRKDESAVSPVIATILMVAITVVLAAVLYVMVSGLLTGPGGGPQTIGVTPRDTGTNWVREVTTTPQIHSLSTTTFVMRWPGNSSIVSMGGQTSPTLEFLKTTRSGVTFIPVSGSAQAELRVLDAITISKTSYVSGMQVSIADGQTILWQGTLS